MIVFVPLLICLVSTYYLTGLIWVIQLLHYPLFARVGRHEFAVYHNEHTSRVLLALSIPVLLHAASSFALLWVRPSGLPDGSIWLNLMLTLAFWVVTALVQIPQHTALSQRFSDEMVQSLVKHNWWRTLLWTFQGLWLFGLTWQSIATALV